MTDAAISAMKTHVMLDLETLGTRPGCKVVSIGAVVFGPAGVSDTQRFSAIINRYPQPTALHEDIGTLVWWSEQSAEAKARIFDTPAQAKPLTVVLADFSDWINSLGPDVLVWGNGADFDNPILSAAYYACGLAQPWGNWNGRCYRTLKKLRQGIQLERIGIQHDALDDAISQAAHAVRILNNIGGWETAQKGAA